MAANERRLGALHEAITNALLEACKGETLPGYTDPETGEEVLDKVLPPSAAILAVGAKFLKDNQITCVPAKDNALGELEEILKARQHKRANRGELQAAQDQAGFLSGLQ